MAISTEGLCEFAQTENLDLSQNNTFASGNLDQFCFTVKASPHEYILTLFGESELSSAQMQEVLSTSKGMPVSYADGRLCAHMHGKELTMLELSAAAQRLLALAHEAKLRVLCCHCASDDNVMLYNDGNEYSALCINCREKASERHAYKDSSVRSRDFKGAMRGALIAFFIYIVAYQLGNITPILGGIFGFCVVMGYQKYDGKFAIKSVGICIAICFVSIAFSEVVSLGIMLFLENFWNGVSPIRAFMLLPIFLSDRAVMRAALADLIYAYIPMMLIHLWWYLRQKKRNK
ncbi:MAG: hypothetical protein RSC38_03590 [Oscillospiraceae bacterium]